MTFKLSFDIIVLEIEKGNQNLKNLLDQASDAYYSGNPIMSDASFDILAAHFNYNVVGHRVTGGLPHYVRMYSLQNVFDLANAPALDYCVETPKLDGAAISILYVNGKLSLALTRGDGIIGQEITDKIALLVPTTIKHKNIVQITGEVLMPSKFENARNLAAGALNLKDLKKFATRPLVFVAYDCSDNPFETWTEMMEVLDLMNFHTVLSFDVTDYPTDGVVYRLDCMAAFKKLGYTSRHPRGAFAYKIQKAGVVTELLDVIWQVGKSGVVSPVAILEPIKIGGATVSRATLHNIEYINDLNLEIGCQIEVIRSGEVIPRVVKRVN